MIEVRRLPDSTEVLEEQVCRECRADVSLGSNRVSTLNGDIRCIQCGHIIGYWGPA